MACKKAVCVLEGSVKGTIRFEQEVCHPPPTHPHTPTHTYCDQALFVQGDGPTTVKGEVTGLQPGDHGFHIHQFGDYSAGKNIQAGVEE